MKTTLDTWKIRRLVDLGLQGLDAKWRLSVEPEYQRGLVWKKFQMQLLIDSVLRDYPVPRIELRHHDDGRYEIIDGQQRIHVLCGFVKGLVVVERTPDSTKKEAFPRLFDTCKESDKKYFPIFLHDKECLWAGKNFKELSRELQEQFLSTEISVSILECDENQARDIFVRLQGGSSLTPQEKRDSWVGDFCELVLKFGGKASLGFYGHFFFNRLTKKYSPDRGKTRQLAAQTMMLLLLRKEKEWYNSFSDTDSDALDNCYRQRISMDMKSSEVMRFEVILIELWNRLTPGPILKSVHIVIHLILFMDMLLEGFSQDWKGKLQLALNEFLAEIAKVQPGKVPKRNEDDNFTDFWNYIKMTKTDASAKKTIQLRHEIFVRQMLRLLGDDAELEESHDDWTPVAMEAIFCRDRRHCHFCKRYIEWGDAMEAAIHTLDESAPKTLANGVLAHKECLPRIG